MVHSQNSRSIDVIDDWKEKFTKRINQQSGSKKVKFTFEDALIKEILHTERDKFFIISYNYLKENPPESNDYIKYVSAYIKTGKKFNIKYFKGDVQKLDNYYAKVDEKKKKNETYNPFNQKAYKNYVIYMVLKLYGAYESADDLLFNVKTIDSREYNPITNIPSVLRGFLPISIKEYDIKKAFPTFLDIELGTNFRHEVYDVLGKINFAKLINANSIEGKGYYYTEIITELKKVYGDKAYLVLSEARFLVKGQLFKDLTKYEKIFIERFIQENDVIHYVRLHDAVILLKSQIVNKIVFDKVEFGIKEIEVPENNSDAKELFYYIDDDGKFKTNAVLIRNYLVASGIVRITTADDKIQLILKKNNIVEFFNYKTDLLILLLEGIIETDDNFSEVEILISREYKNDIFKALPLIKSEKLNFYRDNQNTFGLSFGNGFFLMDKDSKIEIHPYDSMKGFFYKHKIQNHVFTNTTEIGDYEKFVNNIGGDNSEVLKTIIGYMAHDYKDPSNSPAIILSDEGADGTKRNGGRGKSLIFGGLKQLLPTMLKGGKEFNPDYDFVFGDLENGIRLYCIDDVIAGFKYDSLYTNILGGINRQRKGTKAEMLEFENSPKFLITTNWLVPYSADENSTNRRFIEFKVNNYYNSNYSPFDEFGKLFFTQWDNAANSNDIDHPIPI
ncbi:hypothetical protein QO200_18645 [Flavobacterium sp. Arc3]|uniref:hypothetical protein n=1 Tax=Flavobacterium sp. Arc3 TaxID=3046686 RepID=UPI00352BD4F8